MLLFQGKLVYYYNHSTQKVALLIGNQDYHKASLTLKNPIKDFILFCYNEIKKESIMQVAYQLNVNELDVNFLELIKTLFKNKTLYINISTEVEDETAYLLSTQANRERLLNSINNIEHKKERLIHRNIEDLG